MSSFRIALSELDYGPEEEAAVLRVLKSGWLSMGPEVQAFEQEFAQMLGVKHSIAVANATAALHLAFLALGVGPGDEIIQPALNFVAAANMTVACGATPVFADIISLDEPTIDPAEVRRLITPRTKAVVVMHYGGYPCRMADLLAVSQEHGLALVEDACHAVGARYVDPQQRVPHGRMAGSIGDAGAFSFFSNKNLATGEGGMVVTNRDDVAEHCRLLRSHGMTTLTWDRYKGHASSYEVVANGFNYRMDEIRAALGRQQLKRLPAGNRQRGALARKYCEKLAGLKDWLVPFSKYHGDSAFHLMVVLAPDTHEQQRISVQLNELGIQTSLHYPCIPDFSGFVRFQDTAVPLSREFSHRVITLPMHPALGAAGVDEVCRAVIQASNC